MFVIPNSSTARGSLHVIVHLVAMYSCGILSPCAFREFAYCQLHGLEVKQSATNIAEFLLLCSAEARTVLDLLLRI